MSIAMILLWLAAHSPYCWSEMCLLRTPVYYYGTHIPIAEPRDVPAVRKPYISHRKGELLSGKECGRYAALTDQTCRAVYDTIDIRWACRDKSRILLTAEDGTKHCIKFGGNP